MDNRRSSRVSVVLPVTLSGRDVNGVAFKEATSTVGGVNKHGTKLSICHRLAVGDQVRVENPVLGHSATAHVVRVVAKGHSFEIGLELLEPREWWGSIASAPWRQRDVIGEAEFVDALGSRVLPSEILLRRRRRAVRASFDRAFEKVAGLTRSQHVAGSDVAIAAKVEEASATKPPADATSKEQPAEPTSKIGSQSQTSLQESAPHAQEGDKQAALLSRRFDTLTDFLQASRGELESLVAKTHEIQQSSWQALQALFEEVHIRLQQELESTSASFVKDARTQVQEEVSAALEVFGKEADARLAVLLDVALAKSEAARQKIELSLKERADENQKRVADSTASALQEFQHKGGALLDSFRIEIQKTLDELKEKGLNEVSDRLRETSDGLADELRKHADGALKILNEQLATSDRALVDKKEQQLAAFTQEASDTAHQQVDQTRASLEAYLQQSVKAFQKQIDELSKTALEEYRKTTGLLMHDLRNRLDQAARAVGQLGMAGSDLRQPGD